MVKHSLRKLLDKYPYFLDKRKTSNLYKVTDVNNSIFRELYNSLFQVYESFHLNKRLLVWRTQNEPYIYQTHFCCSYPNIKDVEVYKNNILIHKESFTEEEEKTDYCWEYNCSYIKTNMLPIKVYRCLTCGEIYFGDTLPIYCTDCGSNRYYTVRMYRCDECDEIYFTNTPSELTCVNNCDSTFTEVFAYKCLGHQHDTETVTDDDSSHSFEEFNDCGELYIGDMPPETCKVCGVTGYSTSKNLYYNDDSIMIIDNSDYYGDSEIIEVGEDGNVQYILDGKLVGNVDYTEEFVEVFNYKGLTSTKTTDDKFIVPTGATLTTTDTHSRFAFSSGSQGEFVTLFANLTGTDNELYDWGKDTIIEFDTANVTGDAFFYLSNNGATADFEVYNTNNLPSNSHIKILYTNDKIWYYVNNALVDTTDFDTDSNDFSIGLSITTGSILNFKNMTIRSGTRRPLLTNTTTDEETSGVSDMGDIFSSSELQKIPFPIIPDDEFVFHVTTWDEYDVRKGYPERDYPLLDDNMDYMIDEFDHDYSLDEIGALNNIPRKEYLVVDSEYYPLTEPPYNKYRTEDDYHYMKRQITYNLRLWASLELINDYGVGDYINLLNLKFLNKSDVKGDADNIGVDTGNDYGINDYSVFDYIKLLKKVSEENPTLLYDKDNNPIDIGYDKCIDLLSKLGMTEDDFQMFSNDVRLFREYYNPVTLELWKHYSIPSRLVNRERFLLKFFDETKHDFDTETGLVGDWTPLEWEHKDSWCDGTLLNGEFFFVIIDNPRPLKWENVDAHFKLLDGFGQSIIDDYYVNIEVYYDDKAEISEIAKGVLAKDVSISWKKINLEKPTVLRFTAYRVEDDELINSVDVRLYGRNCDNADIYVDTNTNDTIKDGTKEHPFDDLQTALDNVYKRDMVIALKSNISIDTPLIVQNDCKLLGCRSIVDGKEKVPVITNNTGTRKFFNIIGGKSCNFNIVDVRLHSGNINSWIANNTWINKNEDIFNYDIIMVSGGVVYIECYLNKAKYYPTDFVVMTMVLKNSKGVRLPNQAVELSFDGEYVTTLTSDSNGEILYTLNMQREKPQIYYAKAKIVSTEYFETETLIRIDATRVPKTVIWNINDNPVIHLCTNGLTPDDIISVYDNGVVIGTATVNEDGTVCFDYTMSWGKHIILFVDENGNVVEMFILESEIDMSALNGITLLKEVVVDADATHGVMSYTQFTVTNDTVLSDFENVIVGINVSGELLKQNLFHADINRANSKTVTYTDSLDLKNALKTLTYNSNNTSINYTVLGEFWH